MLAKIQNYFVSLQCNWKQWIRHLFERYGYGDSVVFDRYQETFDFTWV